MTTSYVYCESLKTLPLLLPFLPNTNMHTLLWRLGFLENVKLVMIRLDTKVVK